MHLFTTAFAATIPLAVAQVIFNTTTSQFICPLGKTAFCAGTSLGTNIIIRCNGTVGQPGNCNNNLAGVPPRGVKFAQCYECSSTAGNAACSYNNLVYPDVGNPFTIAYGDAKCNATNTTLPSSMPMNSMNVSNTLRFYATLTSTPGALPSASTIAYSTSAFKYMPPSSVPVAPGSGGYNGSTPPVQSFTGGAVNNKASNALARAVGAALAIIATLVA